MIHLSAPPFPTKTKSAEYGPAKSRSLVFGNIYNQLSVTFSFTREAELSRISKESLNEGTYSKRFLNETAPSISYKPSELSFSIIDSLPFKLEDGEHMFLRNFG
jgi:hypothetical protein